jgi:hypothetical protein
MAVGVEHRHEQERRRGERAFRRGSVEHFAQHLQACVLAVRFAGMDAALHEHNRPLRTMGRVRVENAVGGRDQGEHRPAFGRAAEFEAANLVGPGLLIRRTQPLDFGVTPGALIARLLRDCAQVRMRRLARCSQRRLQRENSE